MTLGMKFFLMVCLHHILGMGRSCEVKSRMERYDFYRTQNTTMAAVDLVMQQAMPRKEQNAKVEIGCLEARFGVLGFPLSVNFVSDTVYLQHVRILNA